MTCWFFKLVFTNNFQHCHHQFIINYLFFLQHFIADRPVKVISILFHYLVVELFIRIHYFNILLLSLAHSSRANEKSKSLEGDPSMPMVISTSNLSVLSLLLNAFLIRFCALNPVSQAAVLVGRTSASCERVILDFDCWTK